MDSFGRYIAQLIPTQLANSKPFSNSCLHWSCLLPTPSHAPIIGPARTWSWWATNLFNPEPQCPNRAPLYYGHTHPKSATYYPPPFGTRRRLGLAMACICLAATLPWHQRHGSSLMPPLQHRQISQACAWSQDRLRSSMPTEQNYKAFMHYWWLSRRSALIIGSSREALRSVAITKGLSAKRSDFMNMCPVQWLMPTLFAPSQQSDLGCTFL